VQINDELRVVVEAEVEKAIQKLKAFDDSMGKAEKGAKGLGSALEKQFGEALNAKNAMAQLGAAVSSGLAVYNLASKAVQAFTGFVKSSVGAFGEYETIQSNLAVVLGSTEKAAGAFEELKALAAKTPFSVEGLAETAVQLKQTGTGMREMTETLTMLGDAAGGSGEKFRRMVANYAQIQSVGKTTAMDIRQFAQMGLPINDVLRGMGVQGAATGKQITEAFRIMTSEGGTFYRGMAAGAETLTGKASILADTWKEFKATFAETSGLGAWWKKQLESLAFVVQSYTDAMNEQKALEEARRADKAGTADAEQRARLLDEQIGKLQEALALSRQFPGIGEAELENQLKLYENAGMRNEQAVAALKTELDIHKSYNRQVQSLEEEKQKYRAVVDLAAERNAEEERREELIAESERAYETAQAAINAKFAETEAGKIKAIEDEIKKYQEYLSIRKQVSFTTPVGEKLITVGLGDEEKNRAAAVIAMLAESLAKMKESLGESKKDLADWQKVLKEAMGFSDEDLKKGVLDTGVKAVEEYTQRIEAAGMRMLSLNGLLGNESDLLADTADKWEKLLSAMVESGKWDGTEESFRKAAENLKQAKSALADDAYAKNIEELQKNIDSLGKSEGELARDLAKTNGYTDGQADKVKALTDEYGRKNILASYREEAAKLGKDQYDLALATLEAKGATEEEMAEMEAYIETLREASLASRSWEEVLASWVSSGARDIFPELSKQAAEAVGEISASLASISFEGVLQGLSDVGAAFARGDDAAASFAEAMGRMAQQILDSLPMMFLQAGLQLIAQGQWALGLGFVAAAGSTALISGYTKGKTTEEADKNAHGNVFDQALAQAYAKGASFTNQIVSGPTYFRHGGGLGLMGEAGPEAVIPLKRMANGDLGVESGGGGGPTVVVNIINNSGAEASKEERSDQYGNKRIDVIIGRMIDSHISSGRADKALASRYDVKVKGI
jgi:flavodoxin